MPRIARIVEVDFPHHVIQRGNNRQKIFFDNNDKEKYLDLLRRYIKECPCKTNTYCLMPNHVHMILVPLIVNALSKMMQKLSLGYTQYINKKYKRTGRLWECRFYSSLIERDNYLWAACRYVERNPVRAGMADKPEHYKWSSAILGYSKQKQNDFVDPIWYNNFEKQEYMKFLAQPDEESEIAIIRKATFKGTPLGSANFIKCISEKLGFKIKTRPKGRPRKEK